MPLDRPKIKDLYQQCYSYSLDTHIESLVTSSTLARRTLRFVGTLVKHYQPTSVFEFGSGLSTKFLSDATDSDRRIFSVDHSRYYLQQTQSLVGDASNVTFLLCPIKLYQFRLKGFATYDSAYVRQTPCDLKIDLVLIDGPSGRRFGREAPLYQIAPFLTSETLILLDDANRSPEQEALLNWQHVWPDRVDVFNIPELKSGFSVLQIKNPGNMARFPFRIQDIGRSWPRAMRRVLRARIRERE